MDSIDQTRLAFLRLRRQAQARSESHDTPAMSKQAFGTDGRWFNGEVDKALGILKDAIDIAEAPGYAGAGESLADADSHIAHAVNIIRKFYGDVTKHLRKIR